MGRKTTTPKTAFGAFLLSQRMKTRSKAEKRTGKALWLSREDFTALLATDILWLVPRTYVNWERGDSTPRDLEAVKLAVKRVMSEYRKPVR